MRLTKPQIIKFFEVVTGQRIPDRQRVAVHCPVHPDKVPSATVFLDGNGGFNCSGCGFRGNVFQLAARLKNCSIADAEAHVAEITGADPDSDSLADLGPPVAFYDYRDADGNVIYQKRKYRKKNGDKDFRTFRPVGDGWAFGIDAPGGKCQRVLYNLPSLLTANTVFITEGEGDADNLSALQPFFPLIPISLWLVQLPTLGHGEMARQRSGTRRGIQLFTRKLCSFLKITMTLAGHTRTILPDSSTRLLTRSGLSDLLISQKSKMYLTG